MTSPSLFVFLTRTHLCPTSILFSGGSTNSQVPISFSWILWLIRVNVSSFYHHNQDYVFFYLSSSSLSKFVLLGSSFISGGSFHLLSADIRSFELFSCDCTSAPSDVCMSISPISISPSHCTSLVLSGIFAGVIVTYCLQSIHKADEDLFYGLRLYLGLVGVLLENIYRYAEFL
ncbi:hypothetical protein C8R48DRAFT_779210 [Suillus tomentosus]|nr:hypothetical protein C8R48DRAFT_779210 [Suillus tomentosus]